MMGVSRMTITYIKQRIKDKIGNSLYNWPKNSIY
jgi:hypothetical protein